MSTPDPNDETPEKTPRDDEQQRTSIAHARGSDEFLVPGPTSESNEGLARWGISWLVFSIALMLLMALLSFVCLTLANWTGLT